MKTSLAVSALFLFLAVFLFAGHAAGEGLEYKVETVATGLEIPWALAFAPDGRILVTERPGRIRVIQDGKLQKEPLATIEEVQHTGEGGLMDLQLHPDFKRNGWLYVSYAYRGPRGAAVRVVRYREAGGRLKEPKVIIEEIRTARFHAGCRLGFGPDQKLYVTTGDASKRDLAQQLDSLAGKTLRLNDDGTVPEDNPFTNRKGARPEIWSYGHRNAQGIDWQPQTGTMFQSEHGPSGWDGPGGGDEINIVERGSNLGWPVIHHQQTREGMVAPLLEYTPAVAPASGVFYRGKLFPEMEGNFLVGCLGGEQILRVVLDGKKVVRVERLLRYEYLRIREVAVGPDGAVYFTTSNRDGRAAPAEDDDRVLKLVPK